MEWVERVAAYSSIGVGGGAGYFFFRWLLEYLGGRMDRRADALDKGTQQLIDNLQIQITKLMELRQADQQRIAEIERALWDCQRRHAESDARVKQLEAILQGQGDARQLAQLMMAAEKSRKED